jgi:cell division protein FtsB
MSESQTETFTERIDVTSQPDGAFIGRLEIGVMHSTDREVDQQEELNALRDRIAELERENAALRSKT